MISAYFPCWIVFLNPVQETLWSMSFKRMPGKQREILMRTRGILECLRKRKVGRISFVS